MLKRIGLVHDCHLTLLLRPGLAAVVIPCSRSAPTRLSKVNVVDNIFPKHDVTTVSFRKADQKKISPVHHFQAMAYDHISQ